VSKLRKPAPKFSPHKWGVILEVAFAQIEAVVGALRAENEINEGLRSERLKSGEWQISPDGERTWRLLNWSDWAQRRVRIHRSMLAPRLETYIEGPQFTGQVFICRADLDEYYPTAATPTMTTTHKSDDTRPPERRRGPVLKYEWFAIAGEIARRCINPKTRVLEVPKNERKLAKAMLDWCQAKYGKDPAESEMREAVKAICAALRAHK
jgi:hypothetical protein